MTEVHHKECAVVRDALLSGSFTDISRDKVKEHLRMHHVCAEWASQLLFLSHSLAIKRKKPEVSLEIDDGQLEKYLNGGLAEVDRRLVEDACCHDLHVAGRFSRLKAKQLQTQIAVIEEHAAQISTSLASISQQSTNNHLRSGNRTLKGTRSIHNAFPLAGLACGILALLALAVFRGGNSMAALIMVPLLLAGFFISIAGMWSNKSKLYKPSWSVAGLLVSATTSLLLAVSTFQDSYRPTIMLANNTAPSNKTISKRADDLQSRQELSQDKPEPNQMASQKNKVNAGSINTSQETQPRNHISLPPAFGSTPLSTTLDTQAKYLAAHGAILESAASAKKYNAQAVAMEIQNSAAFVDAYYQRRELNREWRGKESTSNNLDHANKRQEVLKQKLDKFFKDQLDGDVTREMNWLLKEMSGPLKYMNRDSISELDSPMSQEDLEQIYIADGSHSGHKLMAQSSKEKILKTPWPSALEGPEFAADRMQYEVFRDAAIKYISQKGHASEEINRRLWIALDHLLITLETVYPQKQHGNPEVFLRYNSSKCFLQSLISQTNHALTTNDGSAFDVSIHFRGKTLLDLIQHMSQLGLMFDRPQSGNEKVYQNLFTKMQDLYLDLGSEKNEINE